MSNRDEMSAMETDIIAKAQQAVERIIQHQQEDFTPQLMKQLRSELGRETPPLSITECHVLERINENPAITAAHIAEDTGLTRGGISKILTRLENKGYLKTAPKTDNRKELALNLSPLGEKASAVHRQMHIDNLQAWKKLLSARSEQEKKLIDTLLEDVLKAMDERDSRSEG